jgi:multidrug efflux pump subunit AcrA (membrane-fusion protein)
VKVGQRARTFPVTSRYSMYQAFVVSVTPQNSGVKVGVEIAATGRANTKDYVVEIVTTRGDFLSIPNEAIIEEGTSQVVYVKTPGGDYQPQTIQTGIQGELYTQVLGGVKEGNEVVTFGSFFIDSDYKLKGTTTAASK